MKYVIDEFNLKVIEVPDDYIKCIVCHKWMPKSSYLDEHDGRMRSTCKNCYPLKFEDMVELQKRNRDSISANLRSGKMNKLSRELGALRNSMTKEEYIARFNEAMAKIPDGARVCMARYETNNFGEYIEDYMEPDFDPILKFDGKVWVI